MDDTMTFYCLDCNVAPVESELSPQRFYCCKDCGGILSVIKKNKEEQDK